jgi:hypothetical protein
LDDRRDFIVLEDPDGNILFRGRLHKDNRQEGLVELTLNGPEQDAVKSEPMGPGAIWSNESDDQIVQNIIDGNASRDAPGVPTLSTGTVEQTTSATGLNGVNGESAAALRELTDETGAKLRYNYEDWTVDYLQQRGEDRSAEVTLSPGDGVVGRPRIERDIPQNYTHIVGYGGGRNEDQVRVTAEAPDYDGGRKIWGRYYNRDVTDESRLQDIVDRLAADHDGKPRHTVLEEANIVDATADLDIGDWVTVHWPEEDINNQTMRITRLTREWTDRGRKLLARLTTHAETERDRGRERREDIQRFRRSDPGFIDRSRASDGWQLVGDGVDASLPIDWPGNIAENGERRVILLLDGRAWRSPVTTSAHQHEVTINDHIPVISVDNQTHDVTINDHTHDVDVEAPPHLHYLATEDQIDTEVMETSTPNNVDGSVDNHTHRFGLDDDILSTSTKTTTSSSGGGTTTTSSAGGGFETTSGSGGGTTTTTDQRTPLEPKVTTEFNGNEYYPSDVTVYVDGTEVATVAGDSTSSWREEVDLSGELTGGKINDITVESATRGQIRPVLFSRLFRSGPD